MNKLFFSIIISLFSLPILAGSTEEEFVGEWRAELLYGYSLTFDKKGKLEYRFEGEGGSSHAGTYTIKGKTLNYTINDDGSFSKAEQKKLSGKCDINKLTNDIIYQNELKCTGIITGKLYKDVLKSGTERTFDGEKVVTTGLSKSKTIDVPFIRSKANVNAKPHSCSFYSDMQANSGNAKQRNTIPKGHSLTVIARTAKKVKVDKWENYWYYVDPKDDWNTNCPRGWVYGEFISTK